ncbi:MAG: 1-acyl-sn-glycerol-3-phosphate acyltransferase [Erysipelotrichaceae bacterium]|nr:1-acyl-sn-glycerol-3-phosphate acyltransferase [Erysipelotrichaceae bacterium]
MISKETGEIIKEEQFVKEYADRPEFSYRLLRVFFKPLVYLLFHPKVYGLEKIPDGPVVLALNHRYASDPVFIVYAYKKRPIRYLAAKKFHDGIFGFLFRMALTVPVDRSRHTPEVMAAADEILRNGGILGIFPEGTRNRTKEILLPFKYGAVSLAQKNDAYLLPAVNVGKNTPFLSHARMYIGEPYKIDKAADLKSENEKLRQIIYDMYVLYGREDERLDEVRGKRD